MSGIVGTISVSGSIGGINVGGRIDRTGDVVQGANPQTPLPAAKSGTLSTRTSDTAGILTLGSGHGLTTANVVAVFWSGGKRYGCTITAYDSTTITIGSGAGNVLPLQTTVMTVGDQVTVPSLAFDGDDLVMFLLSCDQRACVDFLDVGGASVGCKEVAAGEIYQWAVDQGATLPITGNAVAAVKAYPGGTTTATLTIAALL